MAEPEIECGMCWRAEHLTPAQRDDPANRITGTMRLCEKHERLMNSVAKTFFAVQDHGHFSAESRAGADQVIAAIDDLHAVEWNTTGDVWVLADVMEQDADRAVIKLRENGQTLTVDRRHLRAVRGVGS
jgi:hypothetical protein